MLEKTSARETIRSRVSSMIIDNSRLNRANRRNRIGGKRTKKAKKKGTDNM